MMKLLVLTLLMCVLQGFASETLDEDALTGNLLRELLDELKARDAYDSCMEWTNDCNDRGYCTDPTDTGYFSCTCYEPTKWGGGKCHIQMDANVRELFDELKTRDSDYDSCMKRTEDCSGHGYCMNYPDIAKGYWFCKCSDYTQWRGDKCHIKPRAKPQSDIYHFK